MPFSASRRQIERTLGFVFIVGILAGAYRLNRSQAAQKKAPQAHPLPDLDLSIESSTVAVDPTERTAILVERRKGGATIKRIEPSGTTAPIGEPAYDDILGPSLALAMQGRCAPENATRLRLPPATCTAVKGRGGILIAGKRPDGRVDILADGRVVRTVEGVLTLGYMNHLPDLPEPPLPFVVWRESGEVHAEINDERLAWECELHSDRPPSRPGAEGAALDAILGVMARNMEDGEWRSSHHHIGTGRACGKERDIGLVTHLHDTKMVVAIADAGSGEILAEKTLPPAFHRHHPNPSGAPSAPIGSP